MLGDINRAIEKITSNFSLSKEDFSENRAKFYKNNVRKILKKDFQLDALFDSIDSLGASIQITLRSLSGLTVQNISHNFDRKEIEEWLDENYGEEIETSITIDKNKLIEHIFKETDIKNVSLYINPSSLISSFSFNKIESELFSENKFRLILIPFWDMDIFSNGFITFVGNFCTGYASLLEQFNVSNINAHIDGKVKFLKLYCNTGGLIRNITPDHFYYSEQQQQDIADDLGILKELNALFVKLILYYICNVSDEDYFLVRGYKEIKIKNEIENMSIPYTVVDTLYAMYQSIYTMQTQDKLLIIRNVMTIYLDEICTINDFLVNFDKIFNAFDSSSESYIKEKVKNFFDKKKDLEKYVRDTSDSISKQISSVSENMMKSWLALIGALLGGAVTYFAKADLILISIFFSLFTLLNWLMLLYQLKIATQEQELIQESFTHFLNNVDVISEERKNEIIGTIVEKKHDLLTYVIKRFRISTILATILSLVLALAFAGTAFFHHLNKNNRTKQIPIKQDSVIQSTY
ncbi:MAG: hypothetical protein ACQEXV_01535 [Bacillota bacterium]